MAGAFPKSMLPVLQDINREFHLTKLSPELDHDSTTEVKFLGGAPSLWNLHEVHSFKAKHQRREQPGMPTSTTFGANNPFHPQSAHFILQCSSKVAAEEVVLEINGVEIDLGVSLQPGQALRWTGGIEMVLHDANWQELKRLPINAADLQVPNGNYEVKAVCRFAGSGDPMLKLELRTSNTPKQLSVRR